MLGHAGPIRVDLDVGPGMLRVLLGREIALAQGLLPRGAHVILAALREARQRQDGKRNPRAIAAIRLFPIVMVILRDSKAYQFISLLNNWPLISTPASGQKAQRCFAPGASPDRVHDRMTGQARWEACATAPAFEPARIREYMHLFRRICTRVKDDLVLGGRRCQEAAGDRRRQTILRASPGENKDQDYGYSTYIP